MTSFSQMHCGLRGAAICSAEVVKGIACSLKMKCPQLLYATGETNTDLKEKADVTWQIYNFRPWWK